MAASRRMALSIALVLVAAVFATGATAAAPPGAATSAEPVVTAPGPDGERRGEPRVRGRVEPGEIGPGRAGVDAEDAGGVRAPEVSTAGDVQAAPPTDFATSNSSDPPLLTKHPVWSGASNTPNFGVAAGRDHVVTSDHGVMRITNRAGGSATEVAYADFFLVPDGLDSSGGQVFFDPARGRWIAVQVSSDCTPGGGAAYGHGYLDFAVSDTANPLLGWTIYYYTYNDALTWDPGFGSSNDKVVLTTRFHEMAPGCGTGGPDAWDATVIDWTFLLLGDFDASYFLFPETATVRPDRIVPAVRRDGDSNTIDLIGHIFRFSTSIEEVWHFRITGFGWSAAISGTNLTAAEVIPPVGNTIHINQPTGGFSPGFGLTGLVAQDSRLVGALTQSCTPVGDTTVRNCVRVIDLDTSTATAGRHQDVYIAQNGKHTFSPGVAFSESGDLMVTFQRATDGAGPTAYVVHQSPESAPETFSATRTLVTPTSGYENLNGAERITIAPDPLVRDGVWVVNQAGGTTDPEPTYRLMTALATTFPGATYNELPPVRILDTRVGLGLNGGFQSGTPRTFNVAGANGIPANAVAITGNVTVPAASNAGYASVGPTVTSTPSSSTINFPGGDNRANNVTLPLNADGDLMAVFVGVAGGPDLILDVTGYFLPGDTGSTYEPITAKRVLDTRLGTGLSGRFLVNTPRTFQVTGGSIPGSAVAVTGNLTVVGQSKAGYVSLTPTPQANPTTSTLNFPLGDTRANGVTVPLSNSGTLSAVFKASGGSTDLIFDVTGYYLDGTSGLRFYPLNPGRIMDTRFNSNQLFGQFTSSIARTLVTGGHFGVPGNALAVTGNLTVVGQTRAGYVSITKDPTANPTVSNLNFPAGDVRANGVTVPLNTANDMAIVYKATSGAKTHLLLDLTGYFR